MPQDSNSHPGEPQTGLAASLVSEFFNSGTQHAHAVWPHGMPPINKIFENPYLTKDSPCVKRFCQGAGTTSADGIKGLKTCFAFHGTTVDGIKGIIKDGWDPLRRKAKDGEYFGRTPDVSSSYCQNSCRMLLVLIVKNGHVIESGNSVYIVANDNSSTGPTYCLPIGIIWFGSGQETIEWSHLSKSQNQKTYTQPSCQCTSPNIHNEKLD
jgi:hypothetical protein